jgi:biopolymer transport protein ExbD
MKRRPRQYRLVSEINITPFTDVVLVLLIIFMIATPLIFQSSINVNLPKASSKSPMNATAMVYVTIAANGRIYIDKKAIQRQELQVRMAHIHANNPSVSVVLQADETVAFKEIVSVLDILTELGIKGLKIATANK